MDQWRHLTHDRQTLGDCIAAFKDRLASVNWFMKCLNEPIARQANKLDGCTGHFWEGRYRSQALLPEEALLSCMTYVNLNPVRAGMAKTPKASEYTSVRERIRPAFDLIDAVKEQIDLQAHMRPVRMGSSRPLIILCIFKLFHSSDATFK